jgi:hypothetical protein
MLKRFWESLNYWADALGMDDPAANTSSDWKTVSQSLSAKSKVFGSNPEQRWLGRMTVSINCNRERRRSRDTSFPTVSQAVLKVI